MLVSKCRRNISLRAREVTAEVGLISLKADKRDATCKEGANNARDEETRVLKEHQVRHMSYLFNAGPSNVRPRAKGWHRTATGAQINISSFSPWVGRGLV